MALEGAYAFDDVGEDIVFDFSGNNRHILLSGTQGIQEVGGQTGGALGKTGAGTVSLPAELLAASESEDRTLMYDGLGGRSVWWIRWESISLDTGVWGSLSLDAATTIVRARNQANGSPSPASPTIGALDNVTWHNFALTYVRGNGTLTYYYDGVPIGITEFPDGTAIYVGADDLNIAEWGSTGPSIDNLRIYSHALSPAEVAATAGTPVTFPSDVVEGTVEANLGGLSSTAVGTRVVVAVMTAGLGGLTGTANGTRTTSGSAVAGLGALSATANGTRTSVGTGVALLGSLVVAATGTVTTPSTAAVPLGNLNVIAVGARTVAGFGLALLGGLRVTAVVPSPVPASRIRVSGREPYRYVSGREPREAV